MQWEGSGDIVAFGCVGCCHEADQAVAGKAKAVPCCCLCLGGRAVCAVCLAERHGMAA